MNFDPFGDFDTRGYLRNIVKEKDRDIVRRLEHSSFTTGIDAAFSSLATRKILTYSDVLGTHKILFEAVYPWAGEDRLTNASELAVSKAGLMFANPNDIQRAVNFALEKGQDSAFMKAKPGEEMGYLAYGHPFLDGNGRTIMVVHSVLAQRAGISIDWAATRKNDYLTALTEEIESPGKGHLDAYLNRSSVMLSPMPRFQRMWLVRRASTEMLNRMKCWAKQMSPLCRRATNSRH